MNKLASPLIYTNPSHSAITGEYNGSGVTYTAFAYDGRTGQDLAWNALNLISGVSATSGNTTTQLAPPTAGATPARRSRKRSQRCLKFLIFAYTQQQ